MAITLGSNIASLKAQRQLFSTSDKLGTVFERLSSGQRINRASDDAAGLAIADSLNADRRVFNQGVRNFNDGISLLNIADGALNELSGITTRLVELAEQSANGVLGTTQRASLNEEAQALKDEYFRIAQSTEFNDRQLFTADFGVLRLQGGFGVDGGIASGLGGAIGTGSFENAERYSTVRTPGSFGPDMLDVADFNGDGILDVVEVSEGASELVIYFGQEDGTIGARTVLSSSSDDEIGVEAKDVNNDGIVDIVSVGDSTVSTYLGSGDGTFGARIDMSLGTDLRSVEASDLNGDGLIDLVANGDSNSYVLIGDGAGNFSLSDTLSLGGTSFVVQIGDLNNDGIEDLVSTSTANLVHVFLGNGDGSFATRADYGSSIAPISATLADFNGDGFLDIASGNAASQNVGILLNQGDGTFGAASYIAAEDAPNDLESGDLNGDGNVDLVVGTGSEVSVYQGNGDGTFQPYEPYYPSVGRSLELGDFNRDGVLDILSLGQTSPTLTELFLLRGETTDGVAPLLDFSLETQADARQALPVFQQKLDQLASQRGQIGAFQSRLNVGSSVLSVSAENFAAAESRIRDADIAEESSRLTRLNILQQAASAVLSQANQQPSLALRLLQ